MRWSVRPERYTKEKGYEHDAVVVYGDTDSVFVKFGVDTVAESPPAASARRAPAFWTGAKRGSQEKQWIGKSYGAKCFSKLWWRGTRYAPG